MLNMTQITMSIDIAPGRDTLNWHLSDAAGTVSIGTSSDDGENLVALWSGDLEKMLNDLGYRGGGEIAAHR